MTHEYPIEQVLHKKKKKKHRHLKLSLVIVEIGPIRSQTTKSIQPRPGRPLMRLLLSQCANIANFVLSAVYIFIIPKACPANFVLFPTQCIAYDVDSDGRCGSFGIASNISDLFLRPFRRLLMMFASTPDRKHRDPNGKDTYNL
jgi:hypothetical protein